MKKLPLLLFALLCLSAIITGYDSYRNASLQIRKDLDHALQKTIAYKGVDKMRQDSIRAYKALARNKVEAVTITMNDEMLRQNLNIHPLKEKAYLAYHITPENGKLRVEFRSDASYSVAFIFGLSDQRLPLLLCLFALASLFFSLYPMRKRMDMATNSLGGIWFDDSCGQFKTTDNALLHLTPMQHELMEMFFSAKNHTLAKQQICNRLWPKKPDASDTLYTLIRRLKPIIEAHSQLKIESDRGKSYSLKANDVDNTTRIVR